MWNPGKVRGGAAKTVEQPGKSEASKNERRYHKLGIDDVARESSDDPARHQHKGGPSSPPLSRWDIITKPLLKVRLPARALVFHDIRLDPQKLDPLDPFLCERCV